MLLGPSNSVTLLYTLTPNESPNKYSMLRGYMRWKDYSGYYHVVIGTGAPTKTSTPVERDCIVSPQCSLTMLYVSPFFSSFAVVVFGISGPHTSIQLSPVV